MTDQGNNEGYDIDKDPTAPAWLKDEKRQVQDMSAVSAADLPADAPAWLKEDPDKREQQVMQPVQQTETKAPPVEKYDIDKDPNAPDWLKKLPPKMRSRDPYSIIMAENAIATAGSNLLRKTMLGENRKTVDTSKVPAQKQEEKKVQ